MKLSKDMIEAIRTIIDEKDLDLDYSYVGVRVQEEPFELGKTDHLSHIWVDGEDTEEELDGLCATRIDQLELVDGEYYGEHVAIIVGDQATYGEDVGEIIIKDAVVAEIMC